jgi:hypothetical protein
MLNKQTWQPQETAGTSQSQNDLPSYQEIGKYRENQADHKDRDKAEAAIPATAAFIYRLLLLLLQFISSQTLVVH